MNLAVDQELSSMKNKVCIVVLLLLFVLLIVLVWRLGG